MRLHATLVCILGVTAVTAQAQAVRTSPEAFPIAPPTLNLPVAPAAPARPAPQKAVAVEPITYQLRTGEPIHVDLKSWAEREGWELIWYPTVSWKTLRATEIDRKDVASAVTEVVDILRDEGKPLRLRISEGNKVLEVISTEVRND